MNRLLFLPLSVSSIWVPLRPTSDVSEDSPFPVSFQGAWSSLDRLVGRVLAGAHESDTLSIFPSTNASFSWNSMHSNSSMPVFVSVSSVSVYLKWGDEGSSRPLLLGVPESPPAVGKGSVWMYDNASNISEWKAVAVEGDGEKDAFAWAHQACAAVPLRAPLGEGFACFGGESTTAPGSFSSDLWLVYPSFSSSVNESVGGSKKKVLQWGRLADASTTSLTPHPRFGASLAYTVRGGIYGEEGGIVKGGMEHSLWMYGGASTFCNASTLARHGGLIPDLDVLLVLSSPGDDDSSSPPPPNKTTVAETPQTLKSCTFGDLWRYVWITYDSYPAAGEDTTTSETARRLLGASVGGWQRVSFTPLAGVDQEKSDAANPPENEDIHSLQSVVKSWSRVRESAAQRVTCTVPPPLAQLLHPSPRLFHSISAAGAQTLLLFGGGGA